MNNNIWVINSRLNIRSLHNLCYDFIRVKHKSFIRRPVDLYTCMCEFYYLFVAESHRDFKFIAEINITPLLIYLLDEVLFSTKMSHCK